MASSSMASLDSMPGPSKASHGVLPTTVPEDRLSGAMIVTRKSSSHSAWGDDQISSPSSPKHDGHQHMDVDNDSELINFHHSRPTRLPTVPEASTVLFDLNHHSTISTPSKNNHNTHIGQDVFDSVNNSASYISRSLVPRHSVYPSRLLETQVSSESNSFSQHGLINSTIRPRTSTQVFKTGEELALHYGIPTLLPPPPRTIPRTRQKEEQQQQSPLLDFSTLRANYLNMLSEKPTNNTMSTDCTVTPADLLSSPHMERDDVECWINALACESTTVIRPLYGLTLSVPIASPHFGMDEFLTSPLALGTPAQDFDSSPNETPFSDFLNTPLLRDDELFPSPIIDSDLPLFGPDEHFTPAPASVKTKMAELPELPDFLYTMPPITPGPEVIDPSSLYPSPIAPRPPTSFPSADSDPAPSSSSPPNHSTITTARRRTSATGTRKNISPEKLIPIDAPTQARRYVTPSVTSKKDIPAVFLKKRQRAELDEEEDELLEPLPPNATEREQIEYKRRQNTLAARKSRKRKLIHQQGLESRVQMLEDDVTRWRTRYDVLGKLLQSHGITPPMFD
ncbi:hypothetical protein AX17_006798 [Amanita inopinata Kibby_2008]|nr:hypothetical protein AX17_006798 [Amanita inopinata Kibby_2008]